MHLPSQLLKVRLTADCSENSLADWESCRNRAWHASNSYCNNINGTLVFNSKMLSIKEFLKIAILLPKLCIQNLDILHVILVNINKYLTLVWNVASQYFFN